ncbi:threonine/homoserine/homoserine lactone efflux protein [Balneicella halophila]|uniref:Threonine/homoserine/homoserine lactone efflux protein n=1 Tax=Balneicella halophila TaxID=1537566 RepID=A0A7L4UQG6_BALHA|nr:LysE family translocator [Balneicella halophila]PVX51056.1 threonine/homoserine/homoserine lactone efflux protein [Balneicella halophila]
MITEESIQYLLAAALLGFTSGISPGPMLTLVITQTIRHDRAEGIKVALSPLISDLPIILVAVVVFERLSDFESVFAIISFAGAVFLSYLGIESLKTKALDIDITNTKPGSLKKGIVANFANPNPYIFWATVGIPLLFKIFAISFISSVLFLVVFYSCLVGSKITIAILISKSKAFINQNLYVTIMRLLGITLLIFALLFFYEGLKYLGTIFLIC